MRDWRRHDDPFEEGEVYPTGVKPGASTLSGGLRPVPRAAPPTTEAPAPVPPYGFVQAYGGEVSSGGTWFPDERPVPWMSGAPVHRAAEEGVRGSAGPLPHLETIQPLFGRHDVSSISAHTDGDAASGARRMGAEAYAFGDHVAFASTPSLHIAAHEAAHVVQQRAGVSLKGGVGERDDPYERHADAVADQVVRGESAEGLLDQMAGSGGDRAVQRWLPPGSTASQTQLSPDGFVVVGERLHLERLWYEEYYVSHVAESNRLIFARLSEGPYPWISELSEADLTQACERMELGGGGPDGRVAFETGQDTVYVGISRTVFVWIGMPPGTTFLWEFPPIGGGEAPPDGGEPAPRRRAARLLASAAEYVERGGGGRRFSEPLVNQMLDQLETTVGATLLPGIREGVVASGNMGGPHMIARAADFSYSRASMIEVFGEGAWTAFERGRSGEGMVDSTEAPGNVTVEPGVSQADQEFARRLLQEIWGEGGEGSGAPMRITGRLIAVLREIDAHARREQIIAALRAGGSAAPAEDEAARLRDVMNAVDMQAEYDRLGITAEEGPQRHREFPWPVEGRIINHTDLLFTGKEAAFSVDLTSRDVPYLLLIPPWVRVQWVVRAAASTDSSAPVVARGRTRHRPIIDAPDRFTHEFDRVGTYEVNAIVDHDHYQPNHFTIFVEVRTEAERFEELQDRSFSPGLWGEVDAASDRHHHEFRGTSATDVHDTGRIYEGAMNPLECDPDGPRIPDHLEAIDRRIEEVEAYIASGRAGSGEAAWASQYLETMRATRARITGETAAGAQLLYVEGAYLSRSEGGSSQTLQVVAHAQREGDQWRVTIHDTTQAFDNRNSRFSETDDSFAHAAERAFTELAKAYPRGMMSLRIEALDNLTGQPTGRYLGFELECNSTWEAVRSVVYHPAVMAVVNIAGAAVSIFAPPLGVWIVPTLIAYNAVDTIAGMVDLGARDALTITDVAIGVGQIAIDVIPYVGQATRMVRIGGTVYRVMEGLELMGEVVLMTAQLSEQVQNVRFGYMRQAAEMQADIRRREAANPSDPELPRLREELARLEEAARNEWVTQIGETAIQQGMMRASMHVVRGMHARHMADVDASRTHLETEVASRGATGGVTDVDLPHLQRVMGVPVTRGGAGDGVRIEYEVSRFGGITNLRVVAGEGASLSTIMHHERTLAAMRRYEGVTGSLHNLLERVGAYVQGGGHIPPGSRAFEARFELEKLPGVIRSLREELTSGALDDAAHARVTEQITALEGQLREHARHLDDLAPGLGYVAAGDTTDPAGAPRTDADGAVMGDRPGHPHPTTPGGTTPPVPHGPDIPPPHGRDPAEHERLATERGGAGRNLPAGDRGSRWTGAREADFRYGSLVASSVPDGYHWSSDGAGNPILVRDREIDAAGQPVPRRGFDPSEAERVAGVGHGPLRREDIDAMFPVRGDSIERARYRTDADAMSADGFTPSDAARTEMDAIADRRLEEMQARDHAEGEVHRLRDTLGVTEADLSADNLDDTLARLRREHAGDADALARIDELERQRRALTDARRELVRASEQLGNTAAIDYMRGAHPGAERIFGDTSAAGRPGMFDFVYVVRNEAGQITRIIVVEAKGASSGLGTREVAGTARQQGTPAYLTAIAEMMRPGDGSELDLALQDIMLRSPDGPDVRYILVEAPIDSTGTPRPPRISEFDLSP